MSVVRKLSGRDGRRLVDQGARYRILFQTMSEAFTVCQVIRDPSGRLVDFWVREGNEAFLRMLPGAAGLIGKRIGEFYPNIHPRFFTACHVALTTGQPLSFEHWDPAGRRWYELRVIRLSDDEVGQFCTDITERKKAERSQAELFDELNHRVKNNLTIVSGLLTMQARSAADPQVRQQLLKAVDRIQSIADLHASLYRGGSKEEVDACSYLGDLCGRLSRTLLEGRDISLDLNAEAISLPLDEAVQIGLIVNELVTNAAKHAYLEDEKGVIWVRLSQTGAGLRLCVADLGRGLPEVGSSSGLGMRLVRSLVERAGGEVTVRGRDGATVEVRLPMAGRSPNEPRQDSLL